MRFAADRAGRDLLGARLTRRGVAPAAVLLALSLLPKTAAAVSAAGRSDGTGRGVSRRERRCRGGGPRRGRRSREESEESHASDQAEVGDGVRTGGRGDRGGGDGRSVQGLAAADDDPKVKAELKKFQGTWVLIYAEKAGEEQDVGDRQLKFDGETFSYADLGRDVEDKGTFKLDPSKNPKEIDIRLRKTDNRDEKTVLGIYTWDGENLKLCLGNRAEGRARRTSPRCPRAAT